MCYDEKDYFLSKRPFGLLPAVRSVRKPHTSACRHFSG